MRKRLPPVIMYTYITAFYEDGIQPNALFHEPIAWSIESLCFLPVAWTICFQSSKPSTKVDTC